MARIGTWNLENLARPGSAEGAPDDPAAYDAKLSALAGTITDLAPDVLAVQEVLEPAALDDLVDRLDGAWHTALADPDQRGIRVGVLSRAPFAVTEQVRDLPARLGPVRTSDAGATISTLGRPGLRVRVSVGGREIDVVSVHLKSKLLSYPGGRFSPRDEGERARYAVYALHRRAAEAAGIRDHATALLERGAAVVVAGDLNDEVHAATTQVLQGPPGSEVGTGGFDQPDAGDAQRLWNTAPFIPEDERWSRVYRGRRELIDHVLVSHALVRAVVLATTGAAVVGAVASVGDLPARRRNAPASDHRPVLVDLAPA